MNRLDHAHLFSSDIETTVRWYVTMLGADVIYDTELVGHRNVRLEIGEGALHVYQPPPRGPGRQIVHHLGIRTDDLRGLVAHMQAQGHRFHKAVTEEPAFRYIMCEAPDGLLLELYEVKPGGEWMIAQPPASKPERC